MKVELQLDDELYEFIKWFYKKQGKLVEEHIIELIETDIASLVYYPNFDEIDGIKIPEKFKPFIEKLMRA